MSDLRDLYQEVILDHSKRPRNARKLEHPTCHADGFNPLCGDKITLFLEMDGDRVKDVSFVGSGCAISTASASLMTEIVKGKSRIEAETIFETFHNLVTSSLESVPDPSLGKLLVLGGVREFPMRVKCASLAWHTLKSALEGSGAASTE